MNDDIKKLVSRGLILVVIGVLAFVLLNKKTENGAMLDFVGKDYKQVEFFANQYGLELVISREDNSKYDKDEVISQSITKGTVVEEGQKLEIVVSNG